MHTVADQMRVLAPGLPAHHTPGLGHAAALMFHHDNAGEVLFTVVLLVFVFVLLPAFFISSRQS